MRRSNRELADNRAEISGRDDGAVTVHIGDIGSTDVRTLGDCRFPSPLAELLDNRKDTVHYVDESDRVLADDTIAAARKRGAAIDELPSFEAGGPRRRIYFDPTGVRAAVVTCGGLCPGLNGVIRGIVQELSLHYGVTDVLGFRYGFQGFIDSYRHEPMVLSQRAVRDIHELGGTVLGSSRGAQDPAAIVDRLVREKIDMLFVIGGDGSHQGRPERGRRDRIAGSADLRHRRAEDHRQRHPAHRPQFRFPDRVRRATDRSGPRPSRPVARRTASAW